MLRYWWDRTPGHSEPTPNRESLNERPWTPVPIPYTLYSAMVDDYSLLIVSDLHLSEGRDPVSGKVSRKEDFFFDDDFADFLKYHQQSPGKWKLIINGDFIDFLQITAQPNDGESSLLTDRIYGLKTGAEESVWKLRCVVQGHQQVFESLSEFAIENGIAVISGNHDIEFYYPQVQDAFLKELEAHVSSDQRQKVRAKR